jgi:hypothetical protein
MPANLSNDLSEELPPDTGSLIAWLVRAYPPIVPTVDDLDSERDRMELAKRIGVHELIVNLQTRFAPRQE